jgi:hypothetical protein
MTEALFTTIKFISVFLFLNLVSAREVFSQSDSATEEVCTNSKIRTILFYRSGWDLSMPVYYLNEDESLEFRFDYLDKPEIDFAYAIRNCTYDWQINDISEHYYIEGFNDLPLDDYEPSRNTTQYFTHYSLTIPNDEIKILQSGNYLLVVYDRNDPSAILITRRFCVAENSSEITGQVRFSDDQNQEVSMKVDIGQLNSRNPLSEIKVIILKNYTWNNPVSILTAPLLRDHYIHLDMPFQVIAPGGNEFRFFDTKNTKYDSERVDHIDYRPPAFHFVLKPDEIRQYSPYFTSTDLNGRFYIDVPDANDRNQDADYVEVEFSLVCPQPFSSDVYIYGALTNWIADESNRMTYNADKQTYEKTLLLKQGYFNYAYATCETSNRAIQFDLTEGNHSETENDYLVFVYYCDNASDLDRLVGFSIINSKGKTENNSAPAQ